MYSRVSVAVTVNTQIETTGRRMPVKRAERTHCQSDPRNGVSQLWRHFDICSTQVTFVGATHCNLDYGGYKYSYNHFQCRPSESSSLWVLLLVLIIPDIFFYIRWLENLKSGSIRSLNFPLLYKSNFFFDRKTVLHHAAFSALPWAQPNHDSNSRAQRSLEIYSLKKDFSSMIPCNYNRFS